MRAPLIIITGTGTGIGKTHVARALLHGAKSSGRVLGFNRRADGTPTFASCLGFKPVESGVVDGVTSDAELLDRASTFHVKQSPGLRLRAGVSPHLAAELEGAELDWKGAVRFVSDLRDEGVAVLVELAGGLFTPLATNLRNVDALGALDPTATLLVAPDRLGVLHDVGAALAGAAHVGARIDVVGLVACADADASAGTNARELARFIDIPVVGPWPRAEPEALAQHDATLRVLYTYWLSRSG